MKNCKECKENLPKSLFGINNATKDKLATRCKPCSVVLGETYRRSKGVKKQVVNLAKDGKKFCNKCKTTKFVSSYNKRSTTSDGLQTHCRDCIAKASKTWETNSPEKARARKLKNKYNLTTEQYSEILEAQGGVCKICKGSETRNSYTTFLAVDHCHLTERVSGSILVRGLLCDYCNTGLGRFEDDIDRLKSAIQYLRDAYGE